MEALLREGCRVTGPQQEALSRVAAAPGSAVAMATARILSERYRYIEPHSEGWRLTATGQAHLDRLGAQKEHDDAEARLTREDRDWAARVVAWLEAHERFPRTGYVYLRFARHVAACDHAGIDPAPPEEWTPGARAQVEAETRAAAQILKDFDAACKLAVERGVGVTVDYEAGAKVPRSRRDAVSAAAAGVGVVDIRTYRERRP